MTIEGLIEKIREEVRREEIPVDRPAYERLGKDPREPILYAGSLDAPVVILGRDLGKDEVRFGQPLIGAGGKLVRQGVSRAWDHPELAEPMTRGTLDIALRHALLTNTVPFKPPGNRAYPDPVKERFRPFLLRLLTQFWGGHHVITLGTEAFRWFEPYGSQEEFRGLGRTDRRFSSAFACRLPIPESDPDQPAAREVEVLPLPHPSPLNRRWHAQFPSMLAQRLGEIRSSLNSSSHDRIK
jgi:uracil-DNA glycosylase